MPDRSTPRLLATVLVAVGLFIAVSLPVPYVIESPGPVFNVLGSAGDGPLVTVSGAPTFATTGQLDLTTVSQNGGPGNRVLLTELVAASLRSTDAVVPRALLYPEGTTAAQVDADNTAQMAQSQDAAAIAALRSRSSNATASGAPACSPIAFPPRRSCRRRRCAPPSMVPT